MVKTGELPTLKTRNGYRFFESDLLGWLAAQQVSPFSEAEYRFLSKLGRRVHRKRSRLHLKILVAGVDLSARPELELITSPSCRLRRV